MKIKEAIENIKNKLQELNLTDPNLEADVLLSAVLKKERGFLYSHPEKKISFWQNFFLQRILSKRLAGYSSAAITGHKWFYSLDFIVNKNVLIPRPETELMVEEALKIIKNYELRIKNVIDFGTGSGCIIVSLAKNFPNDKINFYGLDISPKALAIAKKNARRNGVAGRIKFLYSDLLNTIDKSIFKNPVLITANLPYLTASQIENSPAIQKEPQIALLSGSDGLDHYRRLFEQLKEKIGLFRKEVFVLCEIDETQKTAMEKVIRKDFCNSNFYFLKDLNGFYRLAIIELQ
jgi:release factor glutamine methyltransferase